MQYISWHFDAIVFYWTKQHQRLVSSSTRETSGRDRVNYINITIGIWNLGSKSSKVELKKLSKLLIPRVSKVSVCVCLLVLSSSHTTFSSCKVFMQKDEVHDAPVIKQPTQKSVTDSVWWLKLYYSAAYIFTLQGIMPTPR